MITRFLLVSILFLLGLTGFIGIDYLDSPVSIYIYDYSIETTSLTLIFVLIFTVIAALSLIKVVSLIIGFPGMIRKKYAAKRLQQANVGLIQAIFYLSFDNKSKAEQILNKFSKELEAKYPQIYHFVLAETKENYSAKTDLLKKALEAKSTNLRDYEYFIHKRLAQTYYLQGLLEVTVDHTIIAFNISEHDSEILEILIDCYARLGHWPQFAFAVAKLGRTDNNKLLAIAHKIAGYYFLAAKNAFEEGEGKEASRYLETAIELKPGYVDALELYLSVNKKSESQIQKLLKTAFADNPVLEVVELYLKFLDLKNLEIYETLTEIINPQKNITLFLAIAGYLDLPEKFEWLRAINITPPDQKL